MKRKTSGLLPLTVSISIIMFPVLSPAATVVFSNLGAGSSYNTSQGNPIGNAFDGSDYAEGGTFILTGDAIFNSVRIALSCFASCTDPVLVTLTRDGGNQPGTALETFTVPPAALGTLGANNPPLILNSLANLTLIGRTRYWLTVQADLNDSISWNLNSTEDSAPEAISVDNGATWFSPSGNTPGAFEIIGTIPEPGSLGLVLSSALLVCLLRKRART
jgi:hypothetical protein